MDKRELNRLSLKIFLQQQLSMLTALGPVVYMVALLMGLPPEQALRVALINAVINVPFFGVALPLLLIRRLTFRSLMPRAEDKPGDRLKRILELPRRVELAVLVCYLCSNIHYTGWPVYVYDLSPWVIVQVTATFNSLALTAFIRQAVGVERLLQPYALEEFHKHPEARPQGKGFFWPKQRWYLPYCFAIFVFFTLMVTANIVYKKSQMGFDELFADLQRTASPEVVMFVRERIAAIMDSVVVPVILMGIFILAMAAWSAFELVRHQRAGMDAVRGSIESIASGKPALPSWTSTDEVGDLSSATAIAFEELRELSLSLTKSALLLGQSAEQINSSHKMQTEALNVQSASLQETQVTAQEIKQTSLVAAQKAESVLQEAERADEIGRAGESAMEQSLIGLKDIQHQVLEMAQSIRALDERARQIAHITVTMKDLADQSNLLALNAAIEAARSGEQGRGFGVVAREIRNLADQSIRATHHVRQILQDLSNAIRTTADMTERNSEKVQSSVSQVRAFGDNMRLLLGIVRGNASAVRQISTAVSQQNAGINHIFQSVNDLTRMMDQTMDSLSASDSAASQVRAVAAQVSGMVERYGWQSRLVRQAPSMPAANLPRGTGPGAPPRRLLRSQGASRPPPSSRP